MASGNIYEVIRQSDGANVKLTCTEKQLNEYWLSNGYRLKKDIDNDSADKGTTETAKK